MQFDPKIGFILGILTTIEIAISSGTVSLTNVVPAMYVPYVVGWCGLLAFIGSTVMTFLHGYSSGQVGPLVPDAPLDTTIKAVDQAVKDVGSLKSQAVAAGKAIPPAAVILLALVFGALALGYGSAAYAQTARKPTVQLPIDPLHLNTPKAGSPSTTAVSNPLASLNFDTIGQDLQKVVKDVVDKGIADLTAASTDAKNRNDVIAQPCWDAQSAFLKLLPVEWATPPTEVGPALAIQISRDLLNAVTGSEQGSLKVACAALLGDQISIINQVMAIVGLQAIAAPVGL